MLTKPAERSEIRPSNRSRSSNCCRVRASCRVFTRIFSQQAQSGYIFLRPGIFITDRIDGNDVIEGGTNGDRNVQSGSNFQFLVCLLVDRCLARQLIARGEGDDFTPLNDFFVDPGEQIDGKIGIFRDRWNIRSICDMGDPK